MYNGRKLWNALVRLYLNKIACFFVTKCRIANSSLPENKNKQLAFGWWVTCSLSMRK